MGKLRNGKISNWENFEMGKFLIGNFELGKFRNGKISNWEFRTGNFELGKFRIGTD